MKGLVKAALAALVLAAAGSAEAAGGASPWAETPETRARLLAAETAVGNAGRVGLGLEIELAPGWKTYWRSPGESGAPPMLDWSGSENLADIEIAWPAPHSFEAFDLRSRGYDGHVILPLKARPITPGKAMTARLSLDYEVCKDICIPVHAELALALPAGPAASSPHAAKIDRFRGRVPRTNGADGITIARPRLVTDATGPALLVTVRVAEMPRSPELIAEGGPGVALGWPERVAADAPGAVLFRVAVGKRADDEALLGRELTLTYIDGMEAREARLAVER